MAEQPFIYIDESGRLAAEETVPGQWEICFQVRMEFTLDEELGEILPDFDHIDTSWRSLSLSEADQQKYMERKQFVYDAMLFFASDLFDRIDWAGYREGCGKSAIPDLKANVFVATRDRRAHAAKRRKLNATQYRWKAKERENQRRDRAAEHRRILKAAVYQPGDRVVVPQGVADFTYEVVRRRIRGDKTVAYVCKPCGAVAGRGKREYTEADISRKVEQAPEKKQDAS